MSAFNPPGAEKCTRCGKRTNPAKRAWLELNAITGQYHPEGVVPPAESQGFFPFGLDCAKHPNKPVGGAA